MLLGHGLIVGQLVRHCYVLTRLLEVSRGGSIKLASSREVKRALPAMTYGGRAVLRLH